VNCYALGSIRCLRGNWMTTYRIVLEGTTLPGFDAESVRPQLASLTKSAEDVAGRLLSGQSSTVKRGVDQATGLRYVEALRRIGVACRAEAETLDIDIDATSTSPPAPQIEKRPDEKFCTECGAVINAKAEICPKCGVRQITIAQQTRLLPQHHRRFNASGVRALPHY